jgi:hypothetical protein
MLRKCKLQLKGDTVLSEAAKREGEWGVFGGREAKGEM